MRFPSFAQPPPTMHSAAGRRALSCGKHTSRRELRLRAGRTRPTPCPPAQTLLEPEYCKGCLRCIEAARAIASPRQHDQPETGLKPVELHWTIATVAPVHGRVPEPSPAAGDGVGGIQHDFELQDPVKLSARRLWPAIPRATSPTSFVALPACEPMVLKAPTPPRSARSSRLPPRLRLSHHAEHGRRRAHGKILPKIGGHFVQAVSETAAVNMMYGAGGPGVPCITFTSGPGFSLMLEGISYMTVRKCPRVRQHHARRSRPR